MFLVFDRHCCYNCFDIFERGLFVKKKLSHMQIIALGYFIMIVGGALLLLLPFASYNGVTFGETLFTATSCSCVTGLVVVDTAGTYTLFGQAVILVLIQIGGLGFMTMAVLFFRLLRRRIGLREREVIVEGLNSSHVGGILNLTGLIFRGTAIVEGCGALLLAIRFIPLFGFGKGIWYSVFHSISAFCNAGFDLMGTYSGPYSSLTAFHDDWLVTLTLSALIVIGGLGFFVWDDLLRHRLKIRRWALHTKIVLAVNLILLAVGTLLFFLFEREADCFGDRLLHAIFDAVTPRTAGSNTVDTAALTGGSKMLTMFLMFIGGSPGSTAGGAKTTTFAVLVLFAYAQARHSRSTSVFGREIKRDALQKAITVFVFNLSLMVCGTLYIQLIQNLELTDVLFEVLSAINTVGMTTGITRELLPLSRIAVMFLMYLGRVGSTSFAIALLERRASAAIQYPSEDITVG